MRQTERSATEVPRPTNAQQAHDAQPGLENNPADGQIFSRKHPYFPKDCGGCPFAGNRLSALVSDLAGRRDCNRCRAVDRCITKVSAKDNKNTYERLKRNREYEDVHYDKKSGGVKATHRGHNKQKEIVGFGLTGTQLEGGCQDTLFKAGNSAILANENQVSSKGKTLAQLDMFLNGKPCDIASITTLRKHYGMVLVHKNNQIGRYNQREDITDKADSVCLYFHDPAMFDEKKVHRSINYYRYFRKNDGKLLKEHNIKRIYCVLNGDTNIRVYDVP